MLARAGLEITLPADAGWTNRVKEKAALYARQYGSCTQSVLVAFMEEMGIDDPLVVRAAGAMHGGMLSSLTCGIHTAGLMVLGLLIGRESVDQGKTALHPISSPGQTLVRRLNEKLGSSSCREISGVDFTVPAQAKAFFSSGGQEKCVTKLWDGVEVIGDLLMELDEEGLLVPTKR